MENFDRKKHWENIYRTKQIDEVSWYQPVPTTSLALIDELSLPPDANIIDIGGGDSYLVDRLLEKGYNNLTVLDISETALEKARQRLGSNAGKVKWIIADAANFQPTEKYDLWHDRAAFHFLTDEYSIINYIEAAQTSIKPEGNLIISTFSDHGPTKCSGIEIRQYSESSMSDLLKMYFDKIKCICVDHQTPFDSVQNFLFCSFRRR